MNQSVFIQDKQFAELLGKGDRVYKRVGKQDFVRTTPKSSESTIKLDGDRITFSANHPKAKQVSYVEAGDNTPNHHRLAHDGSAFGCAGSAVVDTAALKLIVNAWEKFYDLPTVASTALCGVWLEHNPGEDSLTLIGTDAKCLLRVDIPCQFPYGKGHDQEFSGFIPTPAWRTLKRLLKVTNSSWVSLTYNRERQGKPVFNSDSNGGDSSLVGVDVNAADFSMNSAQLFIHKVKVVNHNHLVTLKDCGGQKLKEMLDENVTASTQTSNMEYADLVEALSQVSEQNYWRVETPFSGVSLSVDIAKGLTVFYKAAGAKRCTVLSTEANKALIVTSDATTPKKTALDGVRITALAMPLRPRSL